MLIVHRFHSEQRGQALAEFALCLPILALVLFGLIEFGLMLNDQVSVVNASRDGARIAALTAGDPNQSSDVQSAVSAAIQPLIPSSMSCSTPAISSTTNSLGGSQTASWSVQVACTYVPFTPLGQLFSLAGGSTPSSSCSGGGFTICSTTNMRDPSCNPPSCSQ